MVIMEISSGLGNQLCTYVCGYSVAKHLNQELVLDVSDYTHKGYFRPYCLDKLPLAPHRKLVYPPASAAFMNESSIPKKLLGNGFRVLKCEEYKTRDALFAAAKGADNIYLLGYGGPHYCTEEDRLELKNQFQLKEPSAAVEQFKEMIASQYSVAVHLRRTDFVPLESHASDEYYRAAITYMKLFYPDAHFYFF